MSNYSGMSIEWIPIRDVVRFLPHEVVNPKEVNSIVKRLKRKPLVRPITVHDNIICDGHHRWSGIKHLFETDSSWRNKSIPICFLEQAEAKDIPWEDIVSAAESGDLFGYKETYTTPRGPEVKMIIKEEKK